MKNLKVVYPYNEILPTKKAHDVYIVQECQALKQAGVETSLLCGRGSDVSPDHYHLSTPFEILPLPIMRKNNVLGLSWNRPFFAATQKIIETQRPDVVILSVRKQAAYHLKRKVSGVKYIYEVHQLMSYQGEPAEEERAMLARCDLVTVTTQALANILRAPPYRLAVPIAVIPLATHTQPLPPPCSGPFTLAYVGQHYRGQGVELLLHAARLERLKIIGAAGESPQFLGYQPPAKLPSLLEDVHAFVAPFEATGRMAYVAHTKLHEYAAWGRPIIAPDLPVVREHFSEGKGTVLFQPGSETSLAQAIAYVKAHLPELQKECEAHRGSFAWDKRATKLISLMQRLHDGDPLPQ